MNAVYPGSFDPVTSGHFDIIVRAAKMFESVIVVVAPNPSKSAVFTVDERVNMVRECCHNMVNVSVDALNDGLLVDYAVEHQVAAIVRGLRAVSDFDHEFQLALLNRRLQPGVETVCLMTGAEYSFLSSSIVKELASRGGDIQGLVPASSLETVRQKFTRIQPG